MAQLFNIDWQSIFTLDTPLLEIFIRGSLVYIALFFLMRIVRRQAGAVGMTDILLIVLIADAAQNAMAGDYKSLPDGLFLVATLVFWNLAFEMAGYYIPAVERLLHPAPLPLVKNGRMIIANMRHQLITKQELMSQLREQGIDDIALVKTACIEGDGQISVVKREEAQGKRKKKII